MAVEYGKMMAKEDVDCVIFNYCVWAWPGFARMAAQFCPKPIILYANYYFERPALVGMLANAGSLDQIGIPFFKLFGDIDKPELMKQLKSYIMGVSAFNRLKGLTYVHVGGRSLSIDTAVADPALWMKKFGIDVDHVDQMELVRRAEIALKEGKQVDRAADYLKKHLKKIHWLEPGGKFLLTEELFRRSIAMYYGLRSLIDEFGYDFAGIKGQRELTEHYSTSDLPEAFLNDYYGPDGTPHDPFICATEADMDAALTMQVFNHVSGGKPALFADIRNYYDTLGFWDFCNSGPSIYHIAQPGRVTLARMTRSKETTKYRMVAMRGEFVDFGAEKNEEYACASQDNWPHAFAKLDCSADTFIKQMHCNHIHGTYGDYIEELRTFCEAADVEFVLLDK
jgi:L-fucose isomerase